ncbi:OsmC family protein [Bryobacter aggregatus]|uniref:OsmC family protein n=1 Tax=Bryobacter aggregatus TaxID=360054 RepID=UPI0004E1F6B6|nr:OsmC family protein [Bryobacter aggregatus]
MKRDATAIWQGDLKAGTGSLTSGSGVLSTTPYSFKTRFEGEPGTNPEELLAAAHAGCFTMALSAQLGERGMVARELKTKCVITLDPNTLTITQSELTLSANIPGADETKFQEAVTAAEKGCPVSKLFRAEIKVNSTLVV